MVAGRFIVSMTGASGAGYGYELISALVDHGLEVSVIYNDTAAKILQDEHGRKIDDLNPMVKELVHNSVMDHELASGSNVFQAMVICPCSTSTASKISSGIADNLTTRVASVALKEGRDLLLVVRETPLSPPVLRSLYDLSTWGVRVMPASPPLYGGSMDDPKQIMRSFTGRILDILGIENELTTRYTPERNLDD